MSKQKEIIILFFSDLITLLISWSIYYWLRVQSGLIVSTASPDFWLPMAAISIYWVFIFFLFGLYKSWYAKSRFDELAAIFKAVTFGVLVLFFAIYADDRWSGTHLHSRLLIVGYWLIVITCVGGGRLLQHSFQRRLLEAGIGLHNAFIIGWSKKAVDLFDKVKKFPALGYRVVGFVPVSPVPNDHSYHEVPILSSVGELESLIEHFQVRDILIAVESSEHASLLSVIAMANSHDVSLKIVPDLYDIISGQARTNQIYGFPLIEIMPQIMQPWERVMKRVIDIFVSAAILLIGLPLWVLVAVAITLDSPGPIFYTQERIGKDGKRFRIIKYRSMYRNAELQSGPVWANKKDPRVTRIGRILRKARIDEVPQLINVLDGDMSLVGPRPERPFFVEQLSKEIPLYKRRLKVRPGVTGWAQVKHKYDENIEDVRRKVEYDLFYIENMSLRMDLKILLNTVMVVFLGKGH